MSSPESWEKITNGKKKKEHFKGAVFFFKPQLKLIRTHKCIDPWVLNFIAGSKAMVELPGNLSKDTSAWLLPPDFEGCDPRYHDF